MRRIIAQLLTSLDGVVEAPETWHFDYWNDEMERAVFGLFERADALLVGRGTYEIFAASWPSRGSDVPLADRINAMPKLVASTRLTSVDWQNSSVIQGDVVTALRELKQLPGGDIFLCGSPSLVRSLLGDGVLDELNLLVHPLVLGAGKRLFDDYRSAKTALRLTTVEHFHTGVLNLTYSAESTSPS